VVGCYGGEEYMAVDVRFADGQCRLFWSGDLEDNYQRSVQEEAQRASGS
jgi:hypothetical protein